MTKCKHCNLEITTTDGKHWRHVEGNHKGKIRCDPAASGLMYGYDAAPKEQPCSFACLGYEND